MQDNFVAKRLGFLINSYVRTAPSRLFAAPNSFRVGRADRHRQRLADGLDRHWRSHILICDLDPADVVPVIEVDL